MRVKTGLTEVCIWGQLGSLDIQSNVASLFYENLNRAHCLLWALDVPHRDAQQGEQGASPEHQWFGFGRQTLGGGHRPRDVWYDGLALPFGIRGVNVPTIRIFPVVQKCSHQQSCPFYPYPLYPHGISPRPRRWGQVIPSSKTT